MTAEDLSQTECEALERSFLLGLARQDLPVPALVGDAAGIDPGLASLALLAQRRRHRRPGAAPAAPAAPRIRRDDSRAVLDEAAGKCLRHLLSAAASRPAAVLLDAAIGRLVAAGLRPHPFQVHRLAVQLKKQGWSATLAGQAWLAEIAPVVVQSAEPAQGTDAADWTEWPRPARIAFIADLRKRDPAGARGLVEACLAAEPATLRAELIGALETGLGADDRALLDRLATDRAQTVREAALRLLAMLPGTDAHDERLAKAVAALRVTREGLLRRRLVIAPVDPSAKPAQFRVLFAGLGLSALAARLELDETALIAGVAPSADALLAALVPLVARTERLDLLGLLVDQTRTRGWPWTRLVPLLAESLSEAAPETRRDLVARLAPFGLEPFPLAADWRALASLCGGTLPADLARPILRSAGWTTFAEALQDTGSPRRREAEADLAALAALLPPALLPALIEAAARQGLAIAGAITAYHAFLAALDQGATGGAAP
jgi:hypothetical protein